MGSRVRLAYLLPLTLAPFALIGDSCGPTSGVFTGHDFDMACSDCNTLIDEITPPCDTNLKKDDPTSFAGAIELCSPWVEMASINADADLKARAILTDFGIRLKPKQGKNFIYLTNGIAADANDPGF